MANTQYPTPGQPGVAVTMGRSLTDPNTGIPIGSQGAQTFACDANGVAWVRLLSGGAPGPGYQLVMDGTPIPSTANGLVTASGLFGFNQNSNDFRPAGQNGSTYDYDLQSYSLIVSAACVGYSATVGTNATIAFMLAPITDAYDPTTAAQNDELPYVANINYVFNGATFDRARTNSAAILSASTQPSAQLTASPGEWSVTHTPATNVQATISKAAGAAGVRHVCRSITANVFGISTAAADTTILVNLRDGATGAGTILWSQRLQIIVGGTTGIAMTGLNIVGSAATAMTLEFSAAGGTGTFESVAVTGYSTI